MGIEQVSDRCLLDMTVDEASDMIDSLTPEPVATPEEEAALLAMLPSQSEATAPMTVVSSLRLPAELKRRLDEAADAEGVSASTFIRQAIESALAGRDKAKLVNVDDVIRAIKAVPHAA